MQQKDNKVPSTIAGSPPKSMMSRSKHMGWERVYLEQLHILKQASKRVHEELLGILDRLTTNNPEFQEKQREANTIDKEIAKIEAKVKQHQLAQRVKGEDEQ